MVREAVVVVFARLLARAWCVSAPAGARGASRRRAGFSRSARRAGASSAFARGATLAGGAALAGGSGTASRARLRVVPASCAVAARATADESQAATRCDNHEPQPSRSRVHERLLVSAAPKERAA